MVKEDFVKMNEKKEAADELNERVVNIRRVAKVVKGGRRFSFSALVVVGDENGTVGVALGKANEASDAIRKGVEKAKKNMFKIPLSDTTIPHEIVGKVGAGRVLLKPASKGTGVIAGGPVRAVVEAAGIRDILTKSLGSQNAASIVHATINGLQNLRNPKDIADLRNKELKEVWGV